jgi:glycosyltransferase involved in cell wall biosynthesis
VLVVTVVHTPLDARIHHRQIRAMRLAGWSVTYAAPFTATGTDLRELVPGTAVRDLPRASGRRRIASLRAARRLLVHEAADHDLILLHDPELLLAVRGIAGRHPVVLDVHEDLAATVGERDYLPGWARRPLSSAVARLEWWAERHVALLLAETRYQDRFRRPHPVIRNLPWVTPADGSAASAASRDAVMYLGRLSRARGVTELLELGRRFLARGGPVLELIGPADADIVGELREADAHGLVRWHGFVPNDRALEQVRGALAGLSLLHDTPNYRVSLPTKILEYASLGVPIITTPLPEAQALLDRHGGGVVVGFGDVGAAAAAVERLRSDAAFRARLVAQALELAQQLSWQRESERFLTALRAAARQGETPG